MLKPSTVTAEISGLIGAARKEAGSAFRFLQLQLPREGEAVTHNSFQFRVDQGKLTAAELQDGHYLLRSNLVSEDPAVLWERYVQLAQIEAAFKTMKSELGGALPSVSFFSCASESSPWVLSAPDCACHLPR